MADDMQLGGKTVLVTGSTDGVGRLAARRLAAAGAHVIIHGRDRERGELLKADIKREGRGTAVFCAADFSSLAEVRRLADVVSEYDRLDLLINNAGIGSGPPRTPRQSSLDGYELRFAINYLAGFLLTRTLLPMLVRGPSARIVNVASLGQHPIDFSDVMLTRGYDGGRAYRQSKLAQIMFTFDLATELDGSDVVANCLHPATYMDTTMVRQSGTQPISTVEEGAEAILNLAVAPTTANVTGQFFHGQRPARAIDQAYDAKSRARLAGLSLDLVGLPRDPETADPFAQSTIRRSRPADRH